MIRHHADLVQGTDEWLAARCGMLTASEMKLIISPTLKIANNEKERAHLWEMLAQRITGHVEPTYIGDDMLRGQADEERARALYAERYARVEEVGFITNDGWGFTLGYSPDGLVGDAGLIECKSRRQKYQIETLTEHLAAGTCPPDYMIQVQTGLLVSGREWCDFVSYSGGLPTAVIRVHADAKIQDAILEAAEAFEARLALKMAAYEAVLLTHGPIPTERTIEREMF